LQITAYLRHNNTIIIPPAPGRGVYSKPWSNTSSFLFVIRTVASTNQPWWNTDTHLLN